MEDKNTINRLLDELERQSEIIAALRLEIATKDKRKVEHVRRCIHARSVLRELQAM